MVLETGFGHISHTRAVHGARAFPPPPGETSGHPQQGRVASPSIRDTPHSDISLPIPATAHAITQPPLPLPHNHASAAPIDIALPASTTPQPNDWQLPTLSHTPQAVLAVKEEGAHTHNTSYVVSPAHVHDTSGVPAHAQIAMAAEATSSASPLVEAHADSAPKVSASKECVLFLRKVYRLAMARMDRLCDALALDEAARARIWALLEHSIAGV